MKSTTIHTPTLERFTDNSAIGSPQGHRRLMAGTPALEGPKLNTTTVSKRRAGSGEKANQRIVNQFINFKIASKVDVSEISLNSRRKMEFLKIKEGIRSG
jgi:hypothetical protein